MLKARASQDGQSRYCAGSIYLNNKMVPQVIHEDGHAAAVGTKVHAMIAEFISEGKVPVFVEPRPPAKEPEEQRLFWQAVRMWKELKGMFSGEVATELTLDSDPSLPGHADVVIYDGERLAVIDWKTGRLPVGREQLVGYVGRVLLQYPAWRVNDIYHVTVMVRENDWNIERITKGEALAHIEGVKAQVRRAEQMADHKELGAYTIGPHCSGCGAADVCPALRLKASAFVDVTMKMPLDSMGPNDLAMGRVIAKHMEQWLDEYGKYLKAYVEKRGPLSLGNGRVYAKTDGKKRYFSDTRTVLRYMESTGIPTANVSSVSATAFDDAVKAWAKENGVKIKDALEKAWKDLESLGAVRVEPTTVYKELKDDGKGD